MFNTYFPFFEKTVPQILSTAKVLTFVNQKKLPIVECSTAAWRIYSSALFFVFSRMILFELTIEIDETWYITFDMWCERMD